MLVIIVDFMYVMYVLWCICCVVWLLCVLLCALPRLVLVVALLDSGLQLMYAQLNYAHL